MRRLLLVGSAALMLAACDSAVEEYAVESYAAPASEYVLGAAADTEAYGGFAGDQDRRGVINYAAAPAAAPTPPSPPPSPPDAQPADGQQPAADDLEQAGRMLAYSYGATLELPARNVRAVIESHEEACRAAGIARCQLLSSNSSEWNADYVQGYLSLRAEPTWLAAFREGLKADAEGADGRLIGQSVYTEDLTLLIVDTEARLSTQRTLREKLEGLLQTQTDDVGDLLAVEREIARVQGDIDSQTSQLAVMRRRVEMSTLDITYNSAPVAFSQNAFAPLGRALNGFFGVFAEAAGMIVSLVAFLIPWLIIAVPALWGLRRWWRARRAKRLAAKAAAPA